MQRMALVLLY